MSLPATRTYVSAEELALAECSRPVDGKPCEVCRPRAERLVKGLERYGMAVVRIDSPT